MIDLDPLTVATIFAMALATYVAKAGGMWVLDRIEISERTEAGLEALPGGIIVAILAPRLVDGDPATWVAAGVVLVVAYKTENVLLSLIVGFVTVLVLRGQVVALLG